MTMQDLKRLKNRGLGNPTSPVPATSPAAPEPAPTRPQLLRQPESSLLVGTGPVRRAPRSGRTAQLNTKITPELAQEIRSRAIAHGGMTCIVLEDALAALALVETMRDRVGRGDVEDAVRLLDGGAAARTSDR